MLMVLFQDILRKLRLKKYVNKRNEVDDLKRIVELEKDLFYHHGMKKILYMN